MNERVKELRKTLKLSGEAFGEKIGVKRAAVSKIEKGENSVTEQNIRLICREFNVNEEWLRTGEGDMFKGYDDEVAESVEELLTEDTPFYNVIKNIMITYKKLNPDSRAIIDDFIKQAFDVMKKEDS